MIEIFQTAIGHHQAGRLDPAERGYQEVLRSDPGQPDALHMLGVVLHQRGRHREALGYLDRAVRASPDAAPVHSNLGEVYRVLGEFDLAETHLRRAVGLNPTGHEAVYNLGLLARQRGQDDEAVSHFESAVGRNPYWPPAFLALGDLHRDAGRVPEALAAYREGVRLNPTAARLHNNLGALLIDDGQPGAALPHCREAVRLAPDHAEAAANLGRALTAEGRFDEARPVLERAVRQNPGLALGYAGMATLSAAEGQPGSGAEWARQAVGRDPANPAYHAQLAGLLYESDRAGEAVAEFREAVRLAPSDPVLRNGLGYILQDVGKAEAAAAEYREAIRLRSGYADAYVNLGILLIETGDRAEAEAAFRSALAVDPRHPEGLSGLALATGGRLDAGEEDAAEESLAAPEVPDRRKAVLGFGLAHAADRRGEYDSAASLAAAANRRMGELARRAGRSYSPDEHRQYVDAIIQVYSQAHFDRICGWGSKSDRPVFVLGLPRSGTSLVEQILASHPQVFGAGELNLMRDCYRAIPGLAGRTAPGIECISDLTPESAATLAARYLDGLDQLAPSFRFVIDKMPDNYLMVGLISTLFPKATVVHVRRDVRDVAVSCWMTHFKHIQWANSPDGITSRVREYGRLMDHWRAVLPGRLLEIDYESVVEDVEGQARRLLDRLGLDWHESCARFHETRRTVRTASMVQVREPVYSRSVQRWLQYKRNLLWLGSVQ